VEAAIKMALQYHHNKGEQRATLIAFEEGFHGDTFGAMSVPINVQPLFMNPWFREQQV